MGYLEKSLLPGERVVLRGQLSPLPLIAGWLIVAGGAVIALAGWFVLASPTALRWGVAAVGGLVILVGLGKLVRVLVARASTVMAVTDRRVLIKTGVVNKDSDEMLLSKIESVELEQTLAGRMLNYGDVLVHGSGETTLRFNTLASPAAFRQACREAVDGALTGRDRDTGPSRPAPAAGAVFEVQVIDGEGDTPRWVEVRAATAEQARQLAAGAGVKVGTARLKRIG